MSMITPEKALEMYKNGALLVDVRTPEEYLALHAGGALNFPLDKIQKDPKEIKTLIEKHPKILLICKSGTRTETAYAVLIKHFSKEFFIVKGGIDAWAEKELPLITDKNSASVS